MRNATVSDCFVCMAQAAPKAPDYIQGIATGAKLSAGSGALLQRTFLAYMNAAMCTKHFDELERELLEADSATCVSFAWVPPIDKALPDLDTFLKMARKGNP